MWSRTVVPAREASRMCSRVTSNCCVAPEASMKAAICYSPCEWLSDGCRLAVDPFDGAGGAHRARAGRAQGHDAPGKHGNLEHVVDITHGTGFGHARLHGGLTHLHRDGQGGTLGHDGAAHHVIAHGDGAGAGSGLQAVESHRLTTVILHGTDGIIVGSVGLHRSDETFGIG